MVALYCNVTIHSRTPAFPRATPSTNTPHLHNRRIPTNSSVTSSPSRPWQMRTPHNDTKPLQHLKPPRPDPHCNSQQLPHLQPLTPKSPQMRTYICLLIGHNAMLQPSNIFTSTNASSSGKCRIPNLEYQSSNTNPRECNARGGNVVRYEQKLEISEMGEEAKKGQANPKIPKTLNSIKILSK